MNRYLIYAVSGASLVIIVFFAGYGAGKDHERARQAAAQTKQVEKDAKAVDHIRAESQKEEKKRETIIREVVRTVKDPSGCLDTDLPDTFVGGLRDAYPGPQ